MIRIKKHILHLFFVAIAVLLSWTAGVVFSIFWGSQKNPNARADAAIVLGAAVWGNNPSPVFAERINHALDLYNQGQVRVLIFTGGIGANSKHAEGDVARAYAIGKGVPPKAILVESKSKTTWENLSGAKKLMVGSNLKSAVIVSDPYHLRRAGMMARKLGMKYVCSPTETSRISGIRAKTKQMLRETYFVTRFLFMGR